MSGARHDVGFEDPILNSINFQINEDFNLDDYNGMDNMTYDLKVLGKEEAKEFVEDNKIDEDKIMSLVKFKLSIGAINSSYPFFVEIEYQSVFIGIKIQA